MQLGSKGMVVAVLFIVRKSCTWPSRVWATDLLSAMIHGIGIIELRERESSRKDKARPVDQKID